MKVYGAPEHITPPELDYANYNYEAYQSIREAYLVTLKEWIIEQGYTRELSGEILSIPHADGCAQYMVADGKPMRLIHLPLGDAWDSPHAHYMPKKEVIRLVTRSKNRAKLFGSV